MHGRTLGQCSRDFKEHVLCSTKVFKLGDNSLRKSPMLTTGQTRLQHPPGNNKQWASSCEDHVKGEKGTPTYKDHSWRFLPTPGHPSLLRPESHAKSRGSPASVTGRPGCGCYLNLTLGLHQLQLGLGQLQFHLSQLVLERLLLLVCVLVEHVLTRAHALHVPFFVEELSAALAVVDFLLKLNVGCEETRRETGPQKACAPSPGSHEAASRGTAASETSS